jgi:DNA replication protein DnaC
MEMEQKITHHQEKSLTVASMTERAPSLEELRQSEKNFLNRKSAMFPVKQLSKEGAEHIKKIKEIVPVDGDAIFKEAMKLIVRPQKKADQAMPFEMAKNLVTDIAIMTLKQRKIKPFFTNFDKWIFTQATKYFINDSSCEWDLQKGLFIWGDVGCGKTFLMEVMKVFVDAANIENRKFSFATCPKIADDVQATNSVQTLFKYYDDGFCFDDLGDEPTQMKSYGNEVLVMVRILTERYRRGVNSSRETHVTSNNDFDELENMYGTRVADRCKEMFNVIFYDGKSKRQ